MSDYHYTFNIWDDNTVLLASIFLRSPDRLKLCGLLEESIGFQYNLSKNLQPVEDDHGYDNMAMCYNRCIFNTSHIYSAYRIVKSNDHPAFFTVIRTVFESVPKLFYCMRRAKEAKHAFCCEWFFWQKWKKRVDEGVDSFCKSVKEPVNSKNCKYVKQPRWFREMVYTENRAKDILELYSEYSENTHPTFEPFIARTREDLEYGWDAGLNRLTGLSLMNAFIMVNATAKGLKARGKYESSKSFIEYAMRNAGGGVRRGMARLYPDKDEYTKKLSFTLPNID